MSRVKTFTNGGSFLPGDLNAIQDDYEGAFSQYSHIVDKSGAVSYSPGVAGSIQLVSDGLTTTSTLPTAFYLDPADYAVPNRSAKYRLRAAVFTNNVAPGGTIVAGLYPITATTGSTPSATVGTVVSGSTAQLVAPGANTRNQIVSADFTPPAAGYYALGFTINTLTSSANLVVALLLQVRQT